MSTGKEAKAAFKKAADMVTCHDMAELLLRDLPAFMDKGLDALSDAEKLTLKEDYAPFLEERENDTAQAAREITDWLSGRYNITKEQVQAQ